MREFQTFSVFIYYITKMSAKNGLDCHNMGISVKTEYIQCTYYQRDVSKVLMGVVELAPSLALSPLLKAILITK